MEHLRFIICFIIAITRLCLSKVESQNFVAQTTSVIRWVDYLLNIWPFAGMKIAQKPYQRMYNFWQIPIQLSLKIAKKLCFCQSGEFSHKSGHPATYLGAKICG